MGKIIMKEVHSQNSKNDSCVIEITSNGLEIKGKCAQGLLDTTSLIYAQSKKLGKEISAYACIGSEGMEKVVLGTIGDSISTSLPYGRVCSTNQRQLPFHTHPTSGQAKFSRVDAETISDRANRGVDDGHCVVGENEIQCLFRVIMPK
jgi:hypothetical protein